jgi:hypothetical protein
MSSDAPIRCEGDVIDTAKLMLVQATHQMEMRPGRWQRLEWAEGRDYARSWIGFGIIHSAELVPP